MKTSDLETKLSYTPEYSDYEVEEITAGFTSDLLSDVMGNAPEDSVLITIQAHKNTVACSSLAGISAIVLCSNRKAPEDMIEAAKDEGIAIFSTKDNQFVASCRINGIL